MPKNKNHYNSAIQIDEKVVVFHNFHLQAVRKINFETAPFFVKSLS